MRRRNGAPAHDRRHYRNIRLIHNLSEHCVCPRDIYTAACKEKRSFRFLQHLERALELPHMDIRIRLVSPDIHSLRIFRAAQLSHHILRKVDEDRSGSPCPGNIEGFLDDPSQIFSPAHCHAVLCDAARDADNVNLLESVISDQVSRHLPCKADKRNAVIVRRRKTCHKIGRTRSARHQTYADLPCRPRIGVRLVDQRLLMSRQDDPDIVLFIQLVADIDGARSGIPEDRVHTFFL